MKSGLITLEGIDGCGKSTIAKLLAERLSAAGLDVELTREPTDTWLGDAVRRSYGEDVSPYTEAYLFLADRATHTDRIKESVAKGKIVISDRYSDSTVAYQAAHFHQRFGGDPRDHMEWLLDMSEHAILRPIITLLFDVDPEISLARLGDRPELEKFENPANLRMVRENYHNLAMGDDRIHVIDASKPVEEVLEASVHAVGKCLGITL